MADNTPEEVAYKLLSDVIIAEGKTRHKDEPNAVDRAYLLKAYADCLHVVKGFGLPK